jgi:hypothetical protein
VSRFGRPIARGAKSMRSNSPSSARTHTYTHTHTLYSLSTRSLLALYSLSTRSLLALYSLSYTHTHTHTHDTHTHTAHIHTLTHTHTHTFFAHTHTPLTGNIALHRACHDLWFMEGKARGCVCGCGQYYKMIDGETHLLPDKSANEHDQPAVTLERPQGLTRASEGPPTDCAVYRLACVVLRPIEYIRYYRPLSRTQEQAKFLHSVFPQIAQKLRERQSNIVPGGKYSNLSPERMREIGADTVPVTTDRLEGQFGGVDAKFVRAPTMSTATASTLTMAKLNGTSRWMQSLDEDELDWVWKIAIKIARQDHKDRMKRNKDLKAQRTAKAKEAHSHGYTHTHSHGHTHTHTHTHTHRHTASHTHTDIPPGPCS